MEGGGGGGAWSLDEAARVDAVTVYSNSKYAAHKSTSGSKSLDTAMGGGCVIV